MLVKDGEGLGALVEDPSSRSSHGYDEGGKGIELVVKTLTGSKLGALNVLAGKHDPCEDGECVPSGIDGPAGGVKETVLDTLKEQRSNSIGFVDGQS